MATPNRLEVVLSFKPLMDGLNRFVAGYQSRMQQVQAFNQRIQNGEAALQRVLGQVGAVLGGAALVKYARDAREADKVQAQLNQTLRQTGQTGALEALNAQASALQKLTLFSDEAVNTVQRLLISFGLSAQQAEVLTESVLDFAQATGQSAESAAMLIGRTLAGDSDELGRYQIKLDTTKGKVDALRDALGRRYAGQARSAVPDAAQRDIEARYAEATENIGRAANTAAVPFFQALLPLLERFAAWATANAQNISSVARSLGNMAASAAPVVLALGGLRAGMTGVALVLNPLRAAVVLFSGRSLLELSNTLAKSTGGFSGLWTTLRGGAGVLTGIGSTLSALGGVAAAAFAGWQLGTIINEIEVSGLKVKDWAALWVVALKDTIGGAFSWLQVAWVNTKFTIQEGLNELLLWIREKQLSIQESLNKLPIGQKYNTKGLRDEIDALNKKIGELEQARVAAVAAIKGERNAQASDNADIMQMIQPDAPTAAGGGKPGGAAAGKPDLNADKFGATDAAKKAAQDLADKRALYELETQIVQARVTGDQATVDRLTRLRDREQALNDLGKEAATIVDARLDAEKALSDQQLDRATKEQEFSRRLGEIGIALAKIEADRYATDEEKRPQRLLLLKEQNRLIAARIELLLAEQALASPTDKLQVQEQIDRLRQQQAGNAGEQESAQPQTIGQGIQAAITAAEDQLGTMAERVGQAFAAVGESIRTSLGGALSDMILKGTNFKDAMLGFGQAIATSFINTGAQMVADWVYQHVVMQGVRSAFHAVGIGETAAATSAQVGIHAAGEQSKTGSSFLGALLRKAAVAGETIYLGVQWVLRKVLHLGGEAQNTTATVAGATVRAAAATRETMPWLIQAGIKAMSAVASIPYVGPFLAIAALAAVIGAGAKLLGGFAEGGLVNGPGTGTSDSIPARLSNGEFVVRATTVDRFGAGFFNDLNAGALNLAALPGGIARQIPVASAGAGSSPLLDTADVGAQAGQPQVKIYNAFFSDQPSARQWLNSKDGQKNLIRMRGDLGLET
ncbi:MAG: hypothetical protein HY302_10585 [Opitutae bacterium]|nr:hypothetical protein [Opitutae bacterium]